MWLREKYILSNVPAWCQDLDEDNLIEACRVNGASYLIDTKSPFALKQGLFEKPHYAFRFKYVSTKGDTFFYFAVGGKVMKVTDSLKVKQVPGIQIYETVIIVDNVLSEFTWKDDVLEFQSNSDPMYMVYESAKKYPQKSAPFYLQFTGISY